MKKLTLQMLKDANACAREQRIFKRLFGEGGNVTLPRVKRAAKAGVDVSWGARNLLSFRQTGAYLNDAHVEYCYGKFMDAPSGSAREHQWRQKLHEAKREAFVRVWNAP